LLGAGFVMLRTGTFENLPAPEPATEVIASPAAQVETAEIPIAPLAAMGEVADVDVELPFEHEDPAYSADPDVRAEAAALRVAVDEEMSAFE
jgi:hypothetical protein